MSQTQGTITPAKSDPPSGAATPLGSEPSASSKSAGMCAKRKMMVYIAHHYPAKKEAKRLEKEAKLAAKAAKAVATTPAGEKKAKEKAAKEEVAPFVNMTPKGQKKGESIRWT